MIRGAALVLVVALVVAGAGAGLVARRRALELEQLEGGELEPQLGEQPSEQLSWETGLGFEGAFGSAAAEPSELEPPSIADTALELAYRGRAMIFGTRMSTSPAGIDAIKRHEAFRANVYPDQGGRPTIGYGHLIRAGERFTGPITEARALELLAGDLRTAEEAVSALVEVPITQQQFDALVSFAFNVGTGAFRGSTLLELLNAGDAGGAAAEFKYWNKVRDPNTGKKVVSNGLVARRATEAALFAAGGTA